MQNIGQQLQKARETLAPIAGANAALEARMLAAHAWSMSHEALLLHGHAARDAAPFAALVERRLTAEPVAQIIGTRDFWKDTFTVTRDVLTPRADSETILETLLRLRPDRARAYRMLDLGTGSGCLILSALREYAHATAVAVDASQAALHIAARNAAALGMQHRCDMLHSNWCDMLDGQFDIILSNPPYIPTADIAALDADVRLHEPISALDGGADGLDDYRRLVRQTKVHAKPGSLLLFEVGMGQANDVSALGEAAGWKLLTITNDLAGIARVVAFELPLN